MSNDVMTWNNVFLGQLTLQQDLKVPTRPSSCSKLKGRNFELKFDQIGLFRSRGQRNDHHVLGNKSPPVQNSNETEILLAIVVCKYSVQTVPVLSRNCRRHQKFTTPP